MATTKKKSVSQLEAELKTARSAARNAREREKAYKTGWKDALEFNRSQ